MVNVGYLSSTTTILFSPTDHPTEKLITFLRSAKKNIYAAVYMITDKNIADELIRAQQNRNVDVQIVTDKITMDNILGRGKYLVANNVPVFVFTGDPIANALKEKNAFINSIMHHKFAIIDDIVWAGSFNWTRSANQFNREDVFVTDESEPRKKYLARFHELKKECQLKTIKLVAPVTKMPTEPVFTYASIKDSLRSFFGFPATTPIRS